LCEKNTINQYSFSLKNVQNVQIEVFLDHFWKFRIPLFPEKTGLFGQFVRFSGLFERFFAVKRSSGQLGWGNVQFMWSSDFKDTFPLSKRSSPTCLF